MKARVVTICDMKVAQIHESLSWCEKAEFQLPVNLPIQIQFYHIFKGTMCPFF